MNIIEPFLGFIMSEKKLARFSCAAQVQQIDLIFKQILKDGVAQRDA
jgi:hypothetical protein